MESSPFSTISDLRRRQPEKEPGRPASSSAGAVSNCNVLQLSRMPAMSLIPMSLFGLLVAYLAFFRASEGSSCCQTLDHPNILFEKYPNNATGNLNATIAIIPISLDQARQYIPPQYRILEHAYRSLLPDFPAGKYPLVMQAGHDHDIRYLEFSIPDFSRVGFEFPFLDLLGDGYSSFRWAPEQMITASNTDAISGSEAYGTKVYPSTFEPECDAYAAKNGETYFRAKADGAKVSLSYRPSKASSGAAYSMDFYKNVTNQPVFIDGASCCQQIRLFDTKLSQGEYAPVHVKARLDAQVGPFTDGLALEDVDAVQVSTPFMENNYISCESLKGTDGVLSPETLQLLR